MNTCLKALGFTLIAVALGTTSIPASAETVPSASIVVESVTLKNIESDRVLFDVNVQVTSDTKLKTKRLQFEQMRLEGMPIYLSPIDRNLELDKNVAVALPPIPLTVFFRDLESLEPLEQIVRDQSAKVTGDVHVDLALNLLERLVTRQWSNYADVPVTASTPVEIPGGFLGQAAALASLSAAQVAMDAGGSVLASPRLSQRAREQDLKARYGPSIVIAESRYTLRTGDDQRMSFAVRGLGFRISEDEFVLTDEMIQPWRYDVDVATAIQSGKASIVEESRELLVSPNSEAFEAATARSLARGQIHLEHQSDKAEETHVPGERGAKEIRILRRDAENNYAVLRFTQTGDKASAAPVAPESIRDREEWDRLAMFFVDHTGKLELVSAPARRQDKQILLDDPIDNRGFGSLLIAPEGAVGMVQDERSGMVLKSNW